MKVKLIKIWKPIPKILVDFGHKRCTQQNKCVILNCPFGAFAPYYNFTCMSASKIENAGEIKDKELISQQKFKSGYKVVRGNNLYQHK